MWWKHLDKIASCGGRREMYWTEKIPTNCTHSLSCHVNTSDKRHILLVCQHFGKSENTNKHESPAKGLWHRPKFSKKFRLAYLTKTTIWILANGLFPTVFTGWLCLQHSASCSLVLWALQHNRAWRQLCCFSTLCSMQHNAVSTVLLLLARLSLDITS